ncbi:MAG TPA: hypothetical protein PKE29_08740 [Phycisphaerales bacterium]|nr:hypothetical protein [Phycisphaerales bacterium]
MLPLPPITQTCLVAALIGGAAIASHAGAGVTILSQSRTLAVETTFDANLLTATTANGGTFVRALELAGTVPGTVGPTPVLAEGRIDCQLDPNKLRASGFVGGAGGFSVLSMLPEAGIARVDLDVTIRVDAPTPCGLAAAPRPPMGPGDQFKVEIRDVTRNEDVYSLDETQPAQTVNTSHTLQPGDYRVRYKVEMIFAGAGAVRGFGFGLAFPRPAPSDCNANGVDDYLDIVLGTAFDANHNDVIDSCECLGDWSGGGLATQDIFDFVNDWLAGSADFDHSGETTVQDIFEFLNGWLAGC